MGWQSQKSVWPLDHMGLQNQVHLTYDLINQADWFNIFVWPSIHSVSLTFAGCPLQLHWLKMFDSSVHWKISFRTWFFQMFFNKSLIKCETFFSCLIQYSKKYWKWPETYVLILHSYWISQFQNFAIPPIWLSANSMTQRYCYPGIAFPLHNFKLLPIC